MFVYFSFDGRLFEYSADTFVLSLLKYFYHISSLIYRTVYMIVIVCMQ